MPPAAESSEDVPRSRHENLVSLARPMARLEESPSPGPARPQHQEPLGLLFDALKPIHSELIRFTTHLAQGEDPGPGPRRRARFPLPVISPRTSSATVRAARSRRTRKAVPRA